MGLPFLHFIGMFESNSPAHGHFCSDLGGCPVMSHLFESLRRRKKGIGKLSWTISLML